MGGLGCQGVRCAALLRRLLPHPALELHHGNGAESVPGALSRWHQDRRLPDGAAAQGPAPVPRQPVHRRRHRPWQDHRSGADRPRAAAAAQGQEHRGRRATFRAGAMEGGTGGPLWADFRGSGPGLRLQNAPGARLRRQSLAHPQPLSGLPQPADRPGLRGPHARMAGRHAARQLADSGTKRTTRHHHPAGRYGIETKFTRAAGISAPASSTACSSRRRPTTATPTASPPCWNCWTPTASPGASRCAASATWKT